MRDYSQFLLRLACRCVYFYGACNSWLRILRLLLGLATRDFSAKLLFGFRLCVVEQSYIGECFRLVVNQSASMAEGSCVCTCEGNCVCTMPSGGKEFIHTFLMSLVTRTRWANLPLSLDGEACTAKLRSSGRRDIQTMQLDT